jgi:hypothetical protein
MKNKCFQQFDFVNKSIKWIISDGRAFRSKKSINLETIKELNSWYVRYIYLIANLL